MAKRVDLYINGVLIDLSDINLALTFTIADIKDPFSRSGGFSKTITIPGTANNRKAFGFSEDVSNETGIDQTQQPTARIEVEGTTITEGVFKITEASRDFRGNIVGYKGVVLGDNGEWLSAVRGLDLEDLDFSVYNHTWTAANITLAEDTTGDVGNIGDEFLLYPLINYGQNVSNSVTARERFPAYNARRIIHKIFNEQGFKIESTFLNGNFFNKLYLPFTNKRLLSPVIDNSRLFRAGLTANFQIDDTTTETVVPLDLDSGNGLFDTGGNFNTSLNRYVVPSPGRYNFSFDFFYLTISTDLDNEFTVRIRKNGAALVSRVLPVSVSSTGQTDNLQTTFHTFAVGDIVDVTIQIKRNITGVQDTFFIGAGFSGAGESFFSNQTNRELSVGELLEVNNNMIQMSQIDFLQGMKHAFNLYFYTDPATRTVYIEPFDDFLNSDIVELSDKLDYSQPITLTYLGDNLSKTIEYRYAEDPNDGFVIEKQKTFDITLGAREVSIDNKFAKDGTLSSSNPVFSPTLMATFSAWGFVSNLLPKLWSNVPEFPDYLPPDFTTDFAPRLLYYNGQTAMATGESWFFGTTERTTFPEFYSVDEVNDNDNSLYYNDTYRSNGLFEKYYRNFHKTLNESRVLTAWFNLNDADISRLDFRRPVQLTIDGETNIYRLNKVEGYNPISSEATKVELLKIVADVPKATVTTVAQNGAQLPPSVIDAPDEEILGIAATIGGVTVPVLVPNQSGNFVQLFKQVNIPQVN